MGWSKSSDPPSAGVGPGAIEDACVAMGVTVAPGTLRLKATDPTARPHRKAAPIGTHAGWRGAGMRPTSHVAGVGGVQSGDPVSTAVDSYAPPMEMANILGDRRSSKPVCGPLARCHGAMSRISVIVTSIGQPALAVHSN